MHFLQCTTVIFFNMTLGCSGSRKYAKIADEEVIIGIPPENFIDIVDALKIFKDKWGEL